MVDRSSKTESSEAQRRNAFANFLAAIDAKDMPMSMTATFQAGWDAAMRRPRSPPETLAPPAQRHSRDCDCHDCHYSKKHPQVKPHHARCGCFECAPRGPVETNAPVTHSPEPSAYLKLWDQHGPCMRVDLGADCEPWLQAQRPIITPLYARLPSAVKAIEPVTLNSCDHRRGADDTGEFCSTCGERLPPNGDCNQT